VSQPKRPQLENLKTRGIFSALMKIFHLKLLTIQWKV